MVANDKNNLVSLLGERQLGNLNYLSTSDLINALLLVVQAVTLFLIWRTLKANEKSAEAAFTAVCDQTIPKLEVRCGRKLESGRYIDVDMIEISNLGASIIHN
jgi:hypothetical protein